MTTSLELFAKQQIPPGELDFSEIMSEGQSYLAARQGSISVVNEYRVESHYIDMSDRKGSQALPNNYACTTTHITAHSQFPSPPTTPEPRRPSKAASIKSFFSGKKTSRRGRRSSSPPPLPRCETEQSRSPKLGHRKQKKVKRAHTDDAGTRKRWNILQKLDMWKFPMEERRPHRKDSGHAGEEEFPTRDLCDYGNLLPRSEITNDDRGSVLSQRISARSLSVYSQDAVSPTTGTFGIVSGLIDHPHVERMRQIPVSDSVANQYSTTLISSLPPFENMSFSSSVSDSDNEDTYDFYEPNKRGLRRSTTQWSNATRPFRSIKHEPSNATFRTAYAEPAYCSSDELSEDRLEMRCASQPFIRVEIESIAPTEDSFDDVSFRSCNSFLLCDNETPDDSLGHSNWEIPTPRRPVTPSEKAKGRPLLWQRWRKVVDNVTAIGL